MFKPGVMKEFVLLTRAPLDAAPVWNELCAVYGIIVAVDGPSNLVTRWLVVGSTVDWTGSRVDFFTIVIGRRFDIAEIELQRVVNRSLVGGLSVV